jgi:hypothetical protein
MKIYMTMKVEDFGGGWADARVDIDDNLLLFLVKTRGQKRLGEFVAAELHSYLEAMVQKNIEMGAIHTESKP